MSFGVQGDTSYFLTLYQEEFGVMPSGCLSKCDIYFLNNISCNVLM